MTRWRRACTTSGEYGALVKEPVLHDYFEELRLLRRAMLAKLGAGFGEGAFAVQPAPGWAHGTRQQHLSARLGLEADELKRCICCEKGGPFHHRNQMLQWAGPRMARMALWLPGPGFSSALCGEKSARAQWTPQTAERGTLELQGPHPCRNRRRCRTRQLPAGIAGTPTGPRSLFSSTPWSRHRAKQVEGPWGQC
jgi:hypothetical protein